MAVTLFVPILNNVTAPQAAAYPTLFLDLVLPAVYSDVSDAALDTAAPWADIVQQGLQRMQPVESCCSWGKARLWAGTPLPTSRKSDPPCPSSAPAPPHLPAGWPSSHCPCPAARGPGHRRLCGQPGQRDHGPAGRPGHGGCTLEGCG